MGTLTETKKAYSSILRVMNENKDLCIFDVAELEHKSKLHLFGIELKETYGFDIDPKNINGLGLVDLGQHTKVCWIGEKHGRTISWPDGGIQPEDELLLYITFPTGAYIFGNDYPTQFFQRFFKELLDLNPKYTDIHNSTLYYSMDNAGSVFNQFNVLYEKYQELNREDWKQRRIQKMKEDLLKLENSK
jgi:hypothetical protein